MDEQSIFLEALRKETPEQRAAFLSEACGDDQGVRHEVEMLLKAHAKVGGFLQGTPACMEQTVGQPITERPGDTIGPYKLLQQIGEGGMGVVYMAEQTEPVERRVALKIIKPGMDTRQVIARFEAERQALAMMDHPNIAKVLDAGTTDTGRPYFVMELVKGLPITQYCDEQHLTPRERLELFLPICQAVQHAHQKGIIHRDLKPSNILVAEYDDRAVPKIIDFGVAKAVSQRLTEKTMFTQYGQIVGTIEYMSPEQAKLNQLDVDTRSDIYSLGVLLYELLTGETPFDKQRLRSAAFDELLRIIREEEPPRPSVRLSTCATLPSVAANRHIEPHKLSTLVRGELDWIVMKAMEKDRGRRYETANAFARDVQHYLTDEAVIACPPSTAYRFRKFARRNKVAIGTTAAVVLALVAGICGTTWQAVRATTAERDALGERDRANEAERIATQRLHDVDVERQRAVNAQTLANEEAKRANAEAERADAERENARTEAAVASAISNFLQQDLLGMADAKSLVMADIEPDPNVKLRTVLDRAAEKIDENFRDEPLVEAAIRFTIGTTYIGLGRYEEAEQQLRRASEIRQRELGSEDPATLASMGDLAFAINLQGRFAEAEAMSRDVFEVADRTLGPEHPLTRASKTNLANAIHQQGRHAEAEAIIREMLEFAERTLGPEHPSTLVNKLNLANTINQQDRHAEAEAIYRGVLEVAERTWGPEHPHTLGNKLNLANTINQQGRHAVAEAMLREVLEVADRTLGREHPITLMTMVSLANAINRQGRYPEAEAKHREVLEVQERALGAEHPSTLNTMTNLAVTIYRQGRFVEAEAMSRDVLEAQVRVLGPEHPSTLMARRTLRACYATRSRELATAADRSERDLNMAAQLAEAAVELFPAAGERSLADWGHLGQMEYLAGRYEDARKSLEKVIELRNDDGPSLKGGPRWWYYTLTLCRLGQLDQARDYYDQLSQLMANEPPGNLRYHAELQAEAGELLGLNQIPETNLGSVAPGDPLEQ